MAWILALLGLYISFTRMYIARKIKTKFSFAFWVKDNWVELSQSVALLLMVMLLITVKQDQITVFLTGIHFPVWLGYEGAAGAAGFCITELMYYLNKKKRGWVKDNTKE